MRLRILALTTWVSSLTVSVRVLLSRFTSDSNPMTMGATEDYADELRAIRTDMELTDTVTDFPAALVKLRLIEDTARDRIAEVCDMAVNMLNNDVWWSGARFSV